MGSFVEDAPPKDAQPLFRECRRALSNNGMMRVATPVPGAGVTDYRNDWRSDHGLVSWREYAYIATSVRMINVAMRAWGQAYLYDFEEMALRLRVAGFLQIDQVSLGEDDRDRLPRLEVCAKSKLVEAW